MPTGINIFKDLHEHKGVIQTKRDNIIDMSLIANTQGEVLGDICYFDDITGINLQEKDKATAADCGNADFTCLGNDRATLDIDKYVDETYLLKQCNVQRLAALSQQSAQEIVLNATAKIDHALIRLEAKNHLNVVSEALDEYVSTSTTETGVYELIEGMINQTIEDNDTAVSSVGREEIVVVVTNKVYSIIRQNNYGCCELLNSNNVDMQNVWGVSGVLVAPQSIMPAGVEIMVYVKPWALFGYNCKAQSVEVGTSAKTRSYLEMYVFENYGSHMVQSTEFSEVVINPGYKYLETTPLLATGTINSTTPATTSVDVNYEYAQNDELIANASIVVLDTTLTEVATGTVSEGTAQIANITGLTASTDYTVELRQGTTVLSSSAFTTTAVVASKKANK